MIIMKRKATGCSIRTFKFNVRHFVKPPKIESSNVAQPRGRSGHRVVANDSFIFVIGGFNPIGPSAPVPFDDLFPEVLVFNICKNTWSVLLNPNEYFPREVASSIAEYYCNCIILHGGTGTPFGEEISNSTFVINTLDSSIKYITTRGSKPPPLYGQASCLDKKKGLMYVVGGTTGFTYSLDIYCLNLLTWEWTKLYTHKNENPPARYRHEIALFQNKIYIFGGGTISEVFSFKSLPVFNLSTNKLETIMTFGLNDEERKYPRRLRCHVGVMVPEEEGRDPYYIICGGFNGSIAFSEVWSLNLSTMVWYQWARELPRDLYFHAGALTPDGKLVIFGGIHKNKRSNQLYSCWVKIPKLSEIAWEAVLYFGSSYLLGMKEKELTALGIPKTFTDRLLATTPRDLEQ